MLAKKIYVSSWPGQHCSDPGGFTPTCSNAKMKSCTRIFCFKVFQVQTIGDLCCVVRIDHSRPLYANECVGTADQSYLSFAKNKGPNSVCSQVYDIFQTDTFQTDTFQTDTFQTDTFQTRVVDVIKLFWRKSRFPQNYEI